MAEVKNGESRGKLTQIIGAVLDVKFDEGNLPEINDAIRIPLKDGSELIVEVSQHLGDDTVRCIAMGSTDGLVRGMEAVSTGAPISVPVGENTLGRIFNVLGQPIDNIPAPTGVTYEPIHRAAPKFEEQATETEMLEEYHRVMDEDKVEAETGYLRFDEAQSLYLDVNNDLLVYPAGQNEQQLGWTAALTGHAAWMSAMKTLLSDPAFTGTPVEAARNVYDGLSEQEQERIQWLQDNAWRYGFIIRWPETGQESTGHVWQPFMIRYVGQEKARDLHAADRTLEESQ